MEAATTKLPLSETLFGDRVLNKLELNSVIALVAYVSHAQKANEETVRDVLKTAFSVNDIKALLASQYDEVIRFLVDLRLNEIIN